VLFITWYIEPIFRVRVIFSSPRFLHFTIVGFRSSSWTRTAPICHEFTTAIFVRMALVSATATFFLSGVVSTSAAAPSSGQSYRHRRSAGCCCPPTGIIHRHQDYHQSPPLGPVTTVGAACLASSLVQVAAAATRFVE
jgi:hypothetical protein